MSDQSAVAEPDETDAALPGTWAPGWYEDPEKNAPYRYYNGERWTDRYRDRPPIAGAQIAGWVTCAAIAVGAAGTWASVGFISVNGLDDGRDGIVTLIGAAIAALCLWRITKKPRSRLAFLVLLIGLGVSAIAIYDIQDLNGGGTLLGSRIEVSVGWGLWLTAVAGVALTLVGIALVRQRAAARRPG